MKATGIVRKIDDLGRVVIPKEIRKSLRIREGDPLEIYVEKNGEIVLKKYATMGDMLEIATQYAETLNKTTGFVACITDTETVIAIAGTTKSTYIAHEISEHILNVMEDRAIWSTMDDSAMSILEENDTTKYTSQIIAPIISDADAIGTVILFSTDYSKKITPVEHKLIQSTAAFLGRQMDP
ncbi:MAG: stage V sporulation T C-terminal domain-containing protein [Clostridia bacterium]